MHSKMVTPILHLLTESNTVFHVQGNWMQFKIQNLSHFIRSTMAFGEKNRCAVSLFFHRDASASNFRELTRSGSETMEG